LAIANAFNDYGCQVITSIANTPEAENLMLLCMNTTKLEAARKAGWL
jgi:hypothetical protein